MLVRVSSVDVKDGKILQRRPAVVLPDVLDCNELRGKDLWRRLEELKVEPTGDGLILAESGDRDVEEAAVGGAEWASAWPRRRAGVAITTVRRARARAAAMV